VLKSLGLSIALLLAAACGGTSAEVATSDVTSYRTLTGELATTVTTYRVAAAAMSTPADCTAARQQYAASARPKMDAMGPLGDRMDAQMGRMGRVGDGDMRCGMDVASSEITRHLSVACAASDMAQNRAEAFQHCDAMQTYATHLEMRGAEVGGMMSGGGMMGGAMQDAGWTMPDGGTMPWTHPMPGCSMLDGGFVMVDGGMPAPGMDGGPQMDGGMMDGGGTPTDGGMMGDGGMP